MSQPLNTELYTRLQSRYGRVLIANEGEAAVPTVISQVGSYSRTILDPEGEMYRVCCPICARQGTRDTRFRLYINHRWGVGHVACPRDRFWWAAHCFNEQCMCDPANRKFLRDAVYNDIGRDVQRYSQIAVGEVADGPPPSRMLPGECLPLADLPSDHPAKAFLRMRGYVPEIIGRHYDLSYCVAVPANMVKLRIVVDRIIAPFKMDGAIVGWQARFVGNANRHRTIKYFTCPGMRTGRVLYAFDQAKQSSIVFICEGITDVWRLGVGAVALCGKNFSHKHFEYVSKNWQTAVVLLDPDAERESGDIYNKLNQKMRVVKVELPAQTDPASLNNDFLFEQIYMAGMRCGCDLADLAKGPILA